MIELHNLVKTRTQSESVFELHVPHFTLLPGQFVAIIGESGCGKSTLLDMLALIMAPTTVERFSIAPNKRQACDVARLWAQADENALARLRRENFGYVLQTGGLLPFLSVRQNILLPGRITGSPIAGQRINTLSRSLGVEHCLDRMPLALSIGQRQRVAIVRALAHQPCLILADEPTAAVDKARARAIMDDMHALTKKDDVAVVVVTHDVDLVMHRADAVYTFETVQVSARKTRSLCQPLERQP